jgi:hypothetical protein
MGYYRFIKEKEAMSTTDVKKRINLFLLKFKKSTGKIDF